MALQHFLISFLLLFQTEAVFDVNSTQCPICYKQLSNKYNMRKHVSEKHIRNKCYVCVYCDRKFIQSSHLRRHYRTLHQNMPEVIQVLHKQMN